MADEGEIPRPPNFGQNLWRQATKKDYVTRTVDFIKALQRKDMRKAGIDPQLRKRQTQFLTGQSQMMGSDPTKAIKSLFPGQHHEVFRQAFRDAFGSFSNEEQSQLNKLFETEFDQLSKRGRVKNLPKLLNQVFSEGKEENLMLQFIYRGRRNLRPMARHAATHYSSENPVHNWGSMPEFITEELKKGDRLLRQDVTGNFASINSNSALNPIGENSIKHLEEIKQGIIGASVAGHERSYGTQYGGMQFLQHESADRSIAAYEFKFKYNEKDLSFRIPIITGDVKDLGYKGTDTESFIGYTGRGLNVRRSMSPVAVVKRGGDTRIMQRSEFFLERFKKELLPSIVSGEISGRKLKQALGELREDVYHTPSPVGGRSLSQPSFAQRRYEQQVGQNLQVFMETGANEEVYSAQGIRQSVVPATGQDMNEFLAANQGKYGVDLNPSKFAKGMVSTQGMEALELADPRSVEHARLDQKIRQKTMAPEAVYAAYKEQTVGQIQHAAKDASRAAGKIGDFAAGLGLDDKRAKDLQSLIRSKNISQQQADWIIKDVSNLGGPNQSLTQRKIRRLESNVASAQERLRGGGQRLLFTNSLTPEEINLYNLAPIPQGMSNRRGYNVDNLTTERRIKASSLLREINGLVGTGQDGQIIRRIQSNSDETIRDLNLILDNNLPEQNFLTKNKEHVMRLVKGAAGGISPNMLSLGTDAEGNRLSPFSKLQESLRHGERIFQAGTYLVDPTKMSGNPSDFFGSGEAMAHNRVRHMLSQEVGQNKKLATHNTMAFEKVNGRWQLRTDADGNILAQSRKTILGTTETGEVVTYDQRMRNMSFNEIESNTGAHLLMEYDELVRPEQHSKLHGDGKYGTYFRNDKSFSTTAGRIGAHMMHEGAEELMTNRVYMDDIIAAAQFGGGRRGQQHIRQVATAMSAVANQFAANQKVGNQILGYGKGNRTERHAGGLLRDADFGQLISQDKDDGLVRFMRQGIGSLSSDWDADQSIFRNEGRMNVGNKVNILSRRGAAHADQVKQMMSWYLKKSIQEGSHKIFRRKDAGGDINSFFNRSQFGAIFGLTETALGTRATDVMLEEIAEERVGGISIGQHFGGKEGMAALRGIAGQGAAWGAMREFIGDAMHLQGAGKKPATIEPRALDILQSPGFGAHGEETVAEIFSRTKAYDVGPSGEQKWKVQAELDKTMLSILNEEKITPSMMENDFVIDLGKDQGRFGAEDIMRQIDEKGNAALGGGSDVWLKTRDGKAIYIPQIDIPGMAKHTLEGGIPAAAEFRGYLYDYLETMETGQASDTAALKTLTAELHPHAAPMGKGMGGRYEI